MAVRAAVLRTKDPIQLIQDLELLDEQGELVCSHIVYFREVCREVREHLREILI